MQPRPHFVLFDGLPPHLSLLLRGAGVIIVQDAGISSGKRPAVRRAGSVIFCSLARIQGGMI